ncbi:hypothetical protein HDU89_000155 [Geranomyces variabilis]|nr:hypothetical protein HDU89_000155 [Geranomyces variabilis]
MSDRPMQHTLLCGPDGEIRIANFRPSALKAREKEEQANNGAAPASEGNEQQQQEYSPVSNTVASPPFSPFSFSDASSPVESQPSSVLGREKQSQAKEVARPPTLSTSSPSETSPPVEVQSSLGGLLQSLREAREREVHATENACAVKKEEVLLPAKSQLTLAHEKQAKEAPVRSASGSTQEPQENNAASDGVAPSTLPVSSSSGPSSPIEPQPTSTQFLESTREIYHAFAEAVTATRRSITIAAGASGALITDYWQWATKTTLDARRRIIDSSKALTVLIIMLCSQWAAETAATARVLVINCSKRAAKVIAATRNMGAESVKTITEKMPGVWPHITQATEKIEESPIVEDYDCMAVREFTFKPEILARARNAAHCQLLRIERRRHGVLCTMDDASGVLTIRGRNAAVSAAINMLDAWEKIKIQVHNIKAHEHTELEHDVEQITSGSPAAPHALTDDRAAQEEWPADSIQNKKRRKPQQPKTDTQRSQQQAPVEPISPPDTPPETSHMLWPQLKYARRKVLLTDRTSRVVLVPPPLVTQLFYGAQAVCGRGGAGIAPLGTHRLLVTAYSEQAVEAAIDELNAYAMEALTHSGPAAVHVATW